MSLVSEALKKAEREAAAREARERGQPAPLETPLQPYRARHGRRRTRGGSRVAAALATVVVLAALALLATRSAPRENAGQRTETVDSSAPPSPVEVQSLATSSVPEEVRSPAETPATPEHRESTSAAASARAAEGLEDVEGPKDAGAAVAPASVRDERPAPPSEPVPAKANPGFQREFVRRIDFPDGSKLELGGIAYSETAPFAYLNGRLLKVGETAAGYTLVAIERDHVVVRGPMGELTIRSRPR